MRNLKRLNLLLLAASLLVFTGCSKIYFHNGPQSTEEMPEASFHHIGILGLVEFSDAVNLKALCADKSWSTVETVNTFLTGLVSGLTYSIYTPRGVATSCK